MTRILKLDLTVIIQLSRMVENKKVHVQAQKFARLQADRDEDVDRIMADVGDEVEDFDQISNQELELKIKRMKEKIKVIKNNVLGSESEENQNGITPD